MSITRNTFMNLNPASVATATLAEEAYETLAGRWVMGEALGVRVVNFTLFR
jgi:hypothetical protein